MLKRRKIKMRVDERGKKNILDRIFIISFNSPSATLNTRKEKRIKLSLYLLRSLLVQISITWTVFCWHNLEGKKITSIEFSSLFFTANHPLCVNFIRIAFEDSRGCSYQIVSIKIIRVFVCILVKIIENRKLQKWLTTILVVNI